MERETPQTQRCIYYALVVNLVIQKFKGILFTEEVEIYLWKNYKLNEEGGGHIWGQFGGKHEETKFSM